MNKTLEFDFAISDHTLSKLDELLNRTFTFIKVAPGDTNLQLDDKFVSALKSVDLSPLTSRMAFGAWLKATGRDNDLLEYTETGVLIGTLAIMLGDRPSPKAQIDKIINSFD